VDPGALKARPERAEPGAGVERRELQGVELPVAASESLSVRRDPD
jgi:hypothetical protein